MKARITKIGTIQTRFKSDGTPTEMLVGWGFDCGGKSMNSFEREDGKPHTLGWTMQELRAMTAAPELNSFGASSIGSINLAIA